MVDKEFQVERKNSSEANSTFNVWKKLKYFFVQKKYVIPVVLVILALMGGVLYISGVFGPHNASSELESNCTLNVLAGKAEMQSAPDTTWSPTNNGMILSAGTRIRTSSDGSAELTFFEGSTLKIGPNSDIEIKSIEKTSDKDTVIVIKQWAGTTWSRVVKMIGPGSSYEIDTPSSYALVRGTAFSTAVDTDGTTTLSVTQGTVVVGAQGQEISVPAGFEVIVETGKGPGQLVPISDSATPVYTPAGTYNNQPVVSSVPATSIVPISLPSPTPTTTPILTPTPSPTPTPTSSSSGGGNDSVHYYNLILTPDDNGVTIPTAGTYRNRMGTRIYLQAIPNPGYSFAQWIGDISTLADVNSATTSVLLNGKKTITATFVQDEYTLDINITGNGSVTKNPDQSTYHYGDNVTLTSVPDTGWSFDNFSGDISGTTITMNGNQTLDATFTQDEYTLDINITGNGSVTKNPDQPTYHYGDNVTLTAIAEPGYIFSSWSGDATGTDNPVIVIMTGNKSVMANFVVTYTLTITTSTGGSVTQPGLGTFTFNQDTVVDLLAIAVPGYSFEHWEGDTTAMGNKDSASTTITMNGNYAIYAKFH